MLCCQLRIVLYEADFLKFLNCLVKVNSVIDCSRSLFKYGEPAFTFFRSCAHWQKQYRLLKKALDGLCLQKSLF